jgi:ABC-type branched-subunit amino acid transport system ATPase component
MSETPRAQVLTKEDHVHAPASAPDEQSTTPALALHGATVRFGGILAIDEISLEVAAGETVGLIGPNGAGKTTLVDVVAGNRRPRPGEVVLYGERVTTMSAVNRARMGLARTFQQLSLFDGMTVREHLMLGYLARAADDMPARGFLSRRSRAQAAVDADSSGLAPNALLARLGLESVADELASTQAVGVVRMVDLARALAARPRLLLLDEPVSGLAEAEARAVAEVIQSIRREHNIAVLVIEHNLEFARLVSDRIVALDFGKIIANGAPDEVLASREVRTAYFGADADEEAAIQGATEEVPDAEAAQGASPGGERDA